MTNKFDISIIISNYQRLEYIQKTLYHMVLNAPRKYTWELVIAEEISHTTDKLIELLHLFDNNIKWKCALFDIKEFEKTTGITKLHNNPSATNNVAILNSDGKILIHQGNEVLATNHIYDKIVDEYYNANNLHTIIYSTTYNIPQEIQPELGESAENLDNRYISYCRQWPLQSKNYKSEVTNYISLYPKESALLLNLYDERFLLGIGADDSDFSRRFRHLPNGKQIYSDLVSLHLDHGGVNCYHDAKPDIIAMSKWNKGLSINRELFNSWDGVSFKNQQPWTPGIYGIKEVIKNYS